MSRSINESVNQLKTSLSDIKTSLSNKNIEGGEQLKVSEVAGLIDQIQAGGGGEDYAILCSPVKFSSMCYGNNYSSLYQKEFNIANESKIVFTDTKAPDDTKSIDVSFNEDNSVVAWYDSDNKTLYVSSQKEGKKIYFTQSNGSVGNNYFISIDYYDGMREPSYLKKINQADLSNLYPLTKNLSSMFANSALKSIDISHWQIQPDNIAYMFQSCSSETIDISGLDLSKIDFGDMAQYVFYSCSFLTTIFAQEWAIQTKYIQSDNYFFYGARQLPSYSSTSGSMAKWKENGGYFTNPAEKGN